MINRIMWSVDTVFLLAIILTCFHDTKQISVVKGDKHECTNNKHCICVPLRDGYLKADCSGKQLRNFPYFFGNVTIIDLSHNDLQEVPDNLEFPITLEELNLSVNNISRLDINAFKHTPHLQTLNLLCNSLQYSTFVFKPGVFSSLLRLKTLLLHHNIDEDVSFDLYPMAISELKSLTSLALDGKEGARFHSSFRNLAELKRLTISGIEGKCDITWLPKHFFVNIPHIQYLDLTGCNLLQMDKGLLQPLSQLNFLNISQNILLTFLVLPNITYDLQWTKVAVLDITKIHCTYGPGTVLFKDDIVSLKNTSVETIIFDSNRLVIADEKVMIELPDSLKTLSFRDNRMTMGLYIYYLVLLRGLTVVHGDNQYTSHNPDENTNRFKFCNDWRGPEKTKIHSVQYLHQSKCPDSKSKGKQKKNTSLHREEMKLPSLIPVPENLSEIYFSNSGLQYLIPELNFTTQNSVTKLIMNNNLLYSWNGPVRNLHKLIHLDLSNNFCSEIKSFFLNDFPSLRFLNISNNLLGFNFGEFFPFRYLRKLETLDFSFNRVQNLSQDIFANLVSLSHLHLQSNLLRHWHFDVGHMKNVKYLDISNNQLTSIPKRIRNQLDRIASKRTLKVKLHGNRFRCDCHNIDFIKWMSDIQRDHRVFENFNTYSCSSQNETNIIFSELSNFLVELETSCGNYSLIIGGVSVAIIISILILVCGMVYRYRWRLRYLYYMTKARYWGRVVVRQPGYNPIYQYDALISYAVEDAAFVRQLQKNLETSLGLKLCLHERDFIGGQPIADNITNAVHNSHRTVVIFSEDYINSYWCMYEFNIARMESMYSRGGADVLFLVKYKPVPVHRTPLQIMSLMKTDTYTEYPNDPERGDVVFYNKLAESIRS